MAVIFTSVSLVLEFLSVMQACACFYRLLMFFDVFTLFYDILLSFPFFHENKFITIWGQLFLEKKNILFYELNLKILKLTQTKKKISQPYWH